MLFYNTRKVTNHFHNFIHSNCLIFLLVLHTVGLKMMFKLKLVVALCSYKRCTAQLVELLWKVVCEPVVCINNRNVQKLQYYWTYA